MSAGLQFSIEKALGIPHVCMPSSADEAGIVNFGEFGRLLSSTCSNIRLAHPLPPTAKK